MPGRPPMRVACPHRCPHEITTVDRRLDFGHPAVTIRMMRALVFPGTYTDPAGTEAIEWRIESERPNSRVPDYLIHTTISKAVFSDIDFDLDPPGNHVTPPFSVDRHGCLTDCLLTGEIPTAITRNGAEEDSTLHFELTLRSDPDAKKPSAPSSPNLVVSIAVGGVIYEATHWDFEMALLELDKRLPEGVCLRCCVTCLLSDYSPYGGHGILTHMACYRKARAAYLAAPKFFDAKGKLEFANIAVTEYVPEPYVCDEYEHRVPGTGYRG
jgi:uncharacterized protein DUF6304